MYPTQIYTSFVGRLAAGVPTLCTNLGRVVHGTRLVGTAYINSDLGLVPGNDVETV
jgi:hypothetical protein